MAWSDRASRAWRCVRSLDRRAVHLVLGSFHEFCFELGGRMHGQHVFLVDLMTGLEIKRCCEPPLL